MISYISYISHVEQIIDSRTNDLRVLLEIFFMADGSLICMIQLALTGGSCVMICMIYLGDMFPGLALYLTRCRARAMESARSGTYLLGWICT